MQQDKERIDLPRRTHKTIAGEASGRGANAQQAPRRLNQDFSSSVVPAPEHRIPSRESLPARTRAAQTEANRGTARKRSHVPPVACRRRKKSASGHRVPPFP